MHKVAIRKVSKLNLTAQCLKRKHWMIRDGTHLELSLNPNPSMVQFVPFFFGKVAQKKVLAVGGLPAGSPGSTTDMCRVNNHY